ncbi:MAG TPA: AMP-binding protein [Streptosporangiaceae bacterium]|nr:AMP-binding protein [Streptosporangiaceae bacterium]
MPLARRLQRDDNQVAGRFTMSSAEYGGTIPRLLAAAAERDSDGTWLRSDAGSLTFSGAVAAVSQTAAALQAAGVGKGDLVMLTASTTPPYLLSWLALTSLGAIAVAVNPRSTPAELAGLITQVKPRLLITDAGLAGVISAARAGTEAAQTGAVRAGTGPAAPAGPAETTGRDVTVPGAPDRRVTGHAVTGLVDGSVPVTPFPSEFDVDSLIPGDWADPVAMAMAARHASLPDTRVGPDDIAVLIPTSGTTGRSKLVMQTHRAYAMAGEGFGFWMELTAADRMLTTLPLFHVNAPAYSVMGSLACGAGLVLAERFSASTFLDTARRHEATEFNAIGAMLEILMRQPERPDDADTPLRLCYTGPAPERERQLAMEQRFGLRIVVGYALSESPYGLIWARGTRPFGTLGSVRQHPVLGTVNHARVVAEAGSIAGPGGTGELELRNPVLTPGYWEMPAETAALMHDGWLRTGDLVSVGDDGTYTFISRVKEVIRRRGENLSPLEVEEVLNAHPAVLECAVVGVPSELSEEEVKAFVVPAAGVTQLDFAELRSLAAARLASFKVPRYWQQVAELPRTPTARVAKHRLPAGHPDGEYDAESAQRQITQPGQGAARSYQGEQ